MPRAAVFLTASLALAVACLVAASGAAATGTPTTTVPTTVAPSTSVGGVAGEVVPTTTTLPAAPTTTVPRGGADVGGIAKPEPAEGWSIERLVTVTALAVVALAAAGYAFGRFRSSPPIHPELVRRPE